MNTVNLSKILNALKRAKQWLDDIEKVDSANINLRAELKLKPGAIHATKPYKPYRGHYVTKY